MGKPRLIILVRHAQSEGNKNRAVHQTTPDHRVKLTHQGHKQAREAGQRLLGMLRPDDTLQFYTSPYLRTRETTTGMLSELSTHPNYNKTKIYEEPRLREQDFGNFQPCSAEMERIWHERAAYGHFFYRIPNGESAADAYDRVSGFNETLWRQFADDDCASVLVLVTHGLMTRVFLMKWYHYSVEYFEDLRNVNHCEFITMERSKSTGKYILQNQLRTWSSYRKEQEAKRQTVVSTDGQTVVKDTPVSYGKEEQPVQLPQRWGGCVNGCNHAKYKWYTYGEPNTNNLNGDDYGKNGKRLPADETKCLVQHVKERLRERQEVLGVGRDFGGSKSGAGSDVEDDTGSGSGGEDDLLEQVKKRLHDRPVEVSISAADGPSHPGEVDGVEGGVALVSPRLSVPPNTAVPAIENNIRSSIRNHKRPSAAWKWPLVSLIIGLLLPFLLSTALDRDIQEFNLLRIGRVGVWKVIGRMRGNVEGVSCGVPEEEIMLNVERLVEEEGVDANVPMENVETGANVKVPVEEEGEVPKQHISDEEIARAVGWYIPKDWVENWVERVMVFVNEAWNFEVRFWRGIVVA